MSLEYLMDGPCGSAVLVKALALATAEALGIAEALVVASRRHAGSLPVEWRAAIMQPRGSAWCVVQLPAADEFQHEEDSLPMLDEAATYFGGGVSERRSTFQTPLTTARLLSERLACEAIGIFGSDQGEALGGAGFFRNGQLERAFCGMPPELARDAVAAMRAQDDEAIAAVRAEIIAFAGDDAFHFEFANGKGERVRGSLARAADAAIAAAALAPEWWEELAEDWAAAIASGHQDPSRLEAFWFAT